MNSKVVIKESRISGLGVFAVRDFKKGEIVLRWDVSQQLSKEEASQASESEKNYIAFFDGKYILQKAPERHVNHSCEPNTFVKDFCDIALRDIKKGEEITSDYSTVPVPSMNIKCNCGSEKCRGIIE